MGKKKQKEKKKKKPGKVDSRPYRPCVGIMLLNADGEVFVGSRVDTDGDNWQMPQGGIGRGESPREAAVRELKEEVGTDQVEILAEASQWLSYDLPGKLSRRIWKGRYRGQSQRWFAMRYLGTGDDIDLDHHHREFAAYRWVPMDRLVDLIIPFKKAVYQEVVEEFRFLNGPESTPRGRKSDAGKAKS